MSSYIQDDVSIFTTPTDEYIVFRKGGWNNTFDTNNKRCSDWGFVSAFKDKEAYDLFVANEVIVELPKYNYSLKGVNSSDSSIGFASLVTARYGKFDKALKEFPFSVADVTADNIKAFQVSLFESFSKAHKGYHEYISPDTLLTRHYDEDKGDYIVSNEKGIEKLKKHYDFGEAIDDKRRASMLSHRALLEEYTGQSTKSLLMDLDFCNSLLENIDLFDRDSLYEVSNTLNRLIKESAIFCKYFPSENLKTLLSMEPVAKRFLLYSFSKDSALATYSRFPSQLSDAFGDPTVQRVIEDVKQSIVDYIAELVKEGKVSEYYIKDKHKELDTIDSRVMLYGKGFHEGEFVKKSLIDALDKEIETEKVDIFSKFKTEWNDIKRKAWFKQTYYMIPEQVERLISIKNDMDAFGISLDNADMSEKSFSNLDYDSGHHNISYCYDNQSKKNQKGIDLGMIALYDNFKDVVFTKIATSRDVRLDEEQALKEGDEFKIPLLSEDTVGRMRMTLPLFHAHLTNLESGVEDEIVYTLKLPTHAEVEEAMRSYQKKEKEERQKKAETLLQTSTKPATPSL